MNRIVHIAVVTSIFCVTLSCGVFVARPTRSTTESTGCSIEDNFFRFSDTTYTYINLRLTTNTDMIVVCLHGLAAHAGNFSSLQDYLYENNISSIAFDLRASVIGRVKREMFLIKVYTSKTLNRLFVA